MAKKAQSMAGRHATPKKSKRKPKQVLRPAPQFRTGSTYQAADVESRPAPVLNPSVTRTRFRSTVQALSSDYGYVVDDLRRIAIIAGALFAIMIFLAFVVK